MRVSFYTFLIESSPKHIIDSVTGKMREPFLKKAFQLASRSPTVQYGTVEDKDSDSYRTDDRVPIWADHQGGYHFRRAARILHFGPQALKLLDAGLGTKGLSIAVQHYKEGVQPNPDVRLQLDKMMYGDEQHFVDHVKDEMNLAHHAVRNQIEDLHDDLVDKKHLPHAVRTFVDPNSTHKFEDLPAIATVFNEHALIKKRNILRPEHTDLNKIKSTRELQGWLDHPDYNPVLRQPIHEVAKDLITSAIQNKDLKYEEGEKYHHYIPMTHAGARAAAFAAAYHHPVDVRKKSSLCFGWDCRDKGQEHLDDGPKWFQHYSESTPVHVVVHKEYPEGFAWSHGQNEFTDLENEPIDPHGASAQLKMNYGFPFVKSVKKDVEQLIPKIGNAGVGYPSFKHEAAREIFGKRVEELYPREKPGKFYAWYLRPENSTFAQVTDMIKSNANRTGLSLGLTIKLAHKNWGSYSKDGKSIYDTIWENHKHSLKPEHLSELVNDNKSGHIRKFVWENAENLIAHPKATSHSVYATIRHLAGAQTRTTPEEAVKHIQRVHGLYNDFKQRSDLRTPLKQVQALTKVINFTTAQYHSAFPNDSVFNKTIKELPEE